MFPSRNFIFPAELRRIKAESRDPQEKRFLFWKVSIGQLFEVRLPRHFFGGSHRCSYDDDVANKLHLLQTPEICTAFGFHW